MYIPRTRYKIKNTTGQEFTTTDGEFYVGPYIETAFGEFFAGDTLKGDKTSLIQNSRNTEDVSGIERPYNDYYGPTEADYRNGFYTRYFIRLKSGKFSEMSKEQWLEKKNRKRLTAGQVNWLLTGPVQGGKYNGIPFKGTSTKNREALERLEKNFPGITDFFKSTSEFVR